ncbi:O-antigen ligase family protein [Hydrogenophaga sp.]|uniref:PglL family O-oligosaccharyltransferase n=1 Tax=Hydrogenophaga sp. TaxID=1904254 RepID=UPI0025B861AC|nr:O-antigen ligase family protein [Hydrogenophaga sp.]
MALAWLIPNASPPWSAFHKDAWASLVMLVVGCSFLLTAPRSEKSYRLDPIASALTMLAIWSIGQWMTGKIFFGGHAVLGFSYLSAGAAAIVLGRSWEERQVNAPGDFVFGAILIGALGSAALILAQWLGIDANDVWVSQVDPSGRPYGNLMQPNNAATLLLLGLVSLYWFHVRGMLRGLVGIVAAILILFVLALTGSRVGYLALAISSSLMVLLGGMHKEFRRQRWAVLFLMVLLPIFVVGVSSPSGSIDGAASVGPNLESRPLTSIRLMTYEAHLNAILANPWWGNGFGQGVKTQLLAAELGYRLPGLFTWAHNAFLDIAGWFGVPALFVLLVAIFLVARALPWSNPTPTRVSYFLGTLIVLLHAMVELPHGYAYFLLPCCLLVGAMTANLGVVAFRMPRWMFVGAFMGLALILAALTRDYLRVEAAFLQWRFQNANFARAKHVDIPRVVLLDQFQALIKGLSQPEADLDEKDITEFEQAVLLFPSASALQRLAEVQVLRGRTDNAIRTIQIAQVLTNQTEWAEMAARWKYLGGINPIFRAVEWPQ